MADRPGLACHGLVKVYETEHSRVQALRGVDLAAACGALTVVVGPSGSGKSSLLRILAGIDHATAGAVVVDGIAIESLPRRRRRAVRRGRIGFVQQRPSDNLAPGVPLASQVAAAARWRGGGGSAAAGLLDRLGLGGLAGNLPDELSGGEQQRGGIARAISGDPAVVLADEPTAELDLAATRIVCALLREHAVESGAAVVVATHDPVVVAGADHVVALRDGAVLSETIGGREVGVIDATGRIQLPPEALEWFGERRAVVETDDATRAIRITPP